MSRPAGPARGTPRHPVPLALVLAALVLGLGGGTAQGAVSQTSAGFAQLPGWSTRVEPERRSKPISMTVVTANVPFTISAKAARREVRRVVRTGPDVVMLQEVHDRPLRRWLRGVPGRWKVVQAPWRTRLRGSAIVYDDRRFDLRQKGLSVGFEARAYDRWMTWAVLRTPRAEVAVVSLHLPPFATRSPKMRRHYKEMSARYRGLATRLHRAGYPVVLGADWNRPLDASLKRWEPVRSLARVRMTTNWRQGTPCVRSTVHGGRIDGFAYRPQRVRLLRQGCMSFLRSDHRPIWARVRTR